MNLLSSTPRLGVNIDHVATLRELRGTLYPDLMEAARLVEEAGADQITIHLREDRRHIQDQDVRNLKANLKVPINLEMATSPDVVRVALSVKPDWACLVPEKRAELTTEGGLDLRKGRKKVEGTVKKLKQNGIRVSLFVEPSKESVKMSYELGVEAIELHTGAYCMAPQKKKAKELERIRSAAQLAKEYRLQVHAGHGLALDNIRPVVELSDELGKTLVEEYNVGHSIVCRATLVGLHRAVKEMVSAVRAP